ncbi:MAG: fibronectin type III domain-containing protein [Actinobacteria bacterium]|nr:fibronectin type III domain-containing protein [Actinomycetota bacterium]
MARQAPIALIGVLLLAILAYAVLASGFPVRQLDLDDTGIWVSNDAAGQFGRFNKAAIGLDARLSPPGQRVSPFALDILQDGNAVFGLDARNGRLTRIDTMAGRPIAEQAVGIDATSSVLLRGGTLAVMDRLGRLWAGRYDPTTGVADLGPMDSALKPLAELGLAADAPIGSAALAVSEQGTIFVAGVNGRLITVEPNGAGFNQPKISDGRPVLKSISITTVAEAVIALDATAGQLVLPNLKTVQLEGDPQAKLQAAGADAATVLVANAKSLLRVSLDSGQLVQIDLVGGGEPAVPVHFGGCDFSAWAGVGRVVRACGNAEPSVQQVAKGLTRPAFRINRGLIVLNDQADGLIYDLDRQTSISWPQPEVEDNQEQEKTDDSDPVESKPKAVDDQAFVRTNRTTALHLLDNDLNTVTGVLSIVTVSRPSPAQGVLLEIAPDGQSVLVSFPPGVPAVRFNYTISDGSASDDGEVVVTDAGTRQTAPDLRPHYVQPAYAVASFGNLTIPVTSEWRDGEGDPVTLLRARDEDGTVIPVTPDGQIDFSPGEAAADQERMITYEVADGTDNQPVSKALRVQVIGKDSLRQSAPIAQPDVVRGQAGRPIVISPLVNDIPGADPRNLAARLTLSGEIPNQANLAVTTDEKTGRVTVVPKREGPYFLDYTVAFGSASQATGRIRVDALRDSGAEPVAMPDQVSMRGRNPVLVDVLANDYDPAGNLLSVQAVTPVDGEQLQAQVIGGRWLRLLPQVDRLAPNPQVVHYAISNGSQTAAGDVLVTQLDDADADRVLVRKDAAVVRVGDSVLIPVLTNDTTLSGQRLRLVTDALGTDHDGELPVYDPAKRGDEDQGDVGRAYVRGDQVRYVPPVEVSATRQVRISYTAANTDGDTAQSEVVVTIKAQPDQANPDRPPVASTVETRVTTGSRVQIPVPTSGQDPDGDSVVVTGIASAPSLGRVVGYGPTSITYEAFPTNGLVGTDSFEYVVTDAFGRSGVGSIRVSVTSPGQTQPPVAIDDQLTVAPGADVRLNALGNDYYSRDDVVTIAALERLNDPLPGAAKLAAEVGPITLTGPGDGDQPVLLNYALVGNGGTGPAATVKVVSKVGYNNPPSVVDQTAKTDGKVGKADLLTKAWDVDGDLSALRVEPLAEVAGATLVGSEYSVPLLDHAQVIPFLVTDAAGGQSAAVVYVGSVGAGAPQLKVGGSIDLATNATASFNIEDYVESPRGRIVRISSAKAATAPSQDLEVKVLNATSFSLTSKNGYVGPASVTLAVMDSASLTDDGVLSATISIPVQVGERTPVLRCPSDPQTVIQGGEAKNLDITTLCHVWSPDPETLAGLNYTADWETPIAGVDATGGGHQIRLQAAGDSTGGAMGTLIVGIAGTAAKPVKMSVRVVAAPPPKLRSVRFTDIKANTAVVVPISLTSPLVDARTKIISVTALEGGAASFTNTDTSVTITPGVDTSGVVKLQVVATDLAGSPERQDRHAVGTITLVVYSRPEAPSAPRTGSTVESAAATLTWQPGAANGAAIQGYRVKIATGPGAGRTIECRSTSCRFTGLMNGEAHTFAVQAFNRAGDSDWSRRSAAITPDTAPGAPSSVSVSDPQNNALVVSWGAIANQGSKLTKIYITYGGSVAEALPGQSSKRITGLDNNQVYTFTVSARNAFAMGPGVSQKGQSSGRPLGLDVATPSPQDLVGATTQADITWSLGSANGPTPVSYDVVRSDGKRVCSNATTRSCTDDSVTFDGTSYTYAVTATNATGGSAHAASDSSPAWRATGTPDGWGSWTAAATGTDGQAQVSYTVPASRGSSSTVAVMNGSSVLRTIGAQTGGVHTATVTGLSDGSSTSLRMRVCNEADRCSYSGAIGVTTFGGLSRPAVSASASGSSVHASATGNGNGAPATLTLYIDGVSVGSDTGTGGLSVSGNRTVGYNHATAVRAELVTGSTNPSRGDGGTATTTATTGSPPLSVGVTQGSDRITTSSCESGCNYVLVTLNGFSGSTHCSIRTDYGGDHEFSAYNASGSGTFNTGAYFGYWGNQVWAVCDGVSSSRVTWVR